MAKDLGKPALEGYLTDIAFVLAEFTETLRHLDRWLQPARATVPVKQQPGHARPLLARMRDAVQTFYGANPRESPDYGRIVNERHFAPHDSSR